MRVLLDESLPRGLAPLLSDHEVVTVPEAGWAGLQNGELLEKATEGYDAFVTIDANLPYQQVLQRFAIGVVLLKAPSNRIADLEPLVPELLARPDGIERGELRRVGALQALAADAGGHARPNTGMQRTALSRRC